MKIKLYFFKVSRLRQFKRIKNFFIMNVLLTPNPVFSFNSVWQVGYCQQEKCIYLNQYVKRDKAFIF